MVLIDQGTGRERVKSMWQAGVHQVRPIFLACGGAFLNQPALQRRFTIRLERVAWLLNLANEGHVQLLPQPAL